MSPGRFLFAIVPVCLVACASNGVEVDASSPDIAAEFVAPISELACPNEDADTASARRAIAKVRAMAGLPALRCDRAAAIAAKGHCRYVVLNGGQLTHVQKKGRPGFTGVTLDDRLAAAAFTESPAGEVLANITGATSITSPAGYLNSVYHRPFFLRRETTSFGYGSEGACSTIDFGRARDRAHPRRDDDDDRAVIWPPNGARNVPFEFYSSRELPNPVPGTTVVGSPVSLIGKNGIRRVVATLEGPGGAVRATTLTRASDPNKLVREGEAHLIPLAPLAADTTYRARFVVTGEDDTAVYETTFHTAPN